MIPVSIRVAKVDKPLAIKVVHFVALPALVTLAFVFRQVRV